GHDGRSPNAIRIRRRTTDARVELERVDPHAYRDRRGVRRWRHADLRRYRKRCIVQREGRLSDVGGPECIGLAFLASLRTTSAELDPRSESIVTAMSYLATRSLPTSLSRASAFCAIWTTRFSTRRSESPSSV